ncbi:bifunctional hydroxymethylpyrimidine kinase/phosphomethylpyrimidine kinase, partial [candidate division WOR-3 bacterium]|nr:bifunctional hydroxymethylpyrimidine kinase/phosphomethylpyrimidine kinase [candidate division WOR-3 bacterium]
MGNKKVIALSGLDPSGKAGFVKDIEILTILGADAGGTVTCFTSQNDEAVKRTEFRSVDSVLSDIELIESPQAIKIGICLPELVPRIKKIFSGAVIVWNTVLFSTSGKKFMDPDAVKQFIEIPDFVTMNTREAEILGRPENSVVTGGHESGKHVKVYYQGKEFRTERVEGEFRGTGCSFSSALAAFLAFGYGIEKAITESMNFLYKILKVS